MLCIKTPSILQMEAVECGAASLAMILAYFKLWVPLETLRVDCGVSRDGSKASHLLKAARKYGLECKGFRREPEDVRKRQKFPVIIFWNFNHFLVLNGFQGNKVFLNDPARGPVVVSSEEFDESFTGVVLEFERGENFKPGGQPASILKGLKSRLQNIGDGLLLIAFIGAALVIPGIVIPTFSQIFVDDILISGRKDWLPALLIAMGLTVLIKGLLTWLQYSVMNRINGKLAITWTCRLFEHVLRLPMSFFGQRFAGDLSSRIQSNDNISTFIASDLGQIAVSIAAMIFYVFIMLSYDIWLTLAGVIIASINIITLKWSAQKISMASQKLAQDNGKLVAAVVGGVSMIETLKATGAENDFFSRVAGHQARIFNARQEEGKVSALVNAIPGGLIILNSAVILGLGGLRVMEGSISMGMLVAFQALMTGFMVPVQQLVAKGSAIQTLSGDMTRVDDVLKYPQARTFKKNKQKQTSPPFARLQGTVEISNMTYGYSICETPLLEGINITLKPGSRVALVGSSGSGKSTIARLISGIIDPWAGDVLFDGMRRADIPSEVLSDSLAVVDQDILLFEGTIRENLTMWDSTITEEAVIAAAKDACIHEIIASRSGLYNSKVTEGGRNFSGGQAQRLEIARALVRNPSILILDEATSALDSQTEMIVDKNLRRRGCSCIIVAHRLSAIRDCDEIIVLEMGKIVQRGTHNSMIEIEGPYKKLIGNIDS